MVLTRVVLVSSQSCNFRKLVLLWPCFCCLGPCFFSRLTRGSHGAHTGLTAFLCVHLLKPARKVFLGMLGFALALPPPCTYQSQAATERVVWSPQGLVTESHQYVPRDWQPGPEAGFALPGQHSVLSPASQPLLPWDSSGACSLVGVTILCRWPKHHFITY